ncbi:hypothetical protein H5P28_04095 [Ruficoccus amylovorans]|uniref:Uncharacterized protein n=1 Tax=Ruficoccus amylovorans TaxID=1804625 RepID=A0A842HAQ6_9BACT|nr:hypothetical protein [Ruficoccus amylovorans]MBC2593435.1 hypothetical protein [Ruficoccus amylovorans]
MQKDSKKDRHQNWHPNFRLTETLPDIKVVRTGFLVNFVAILVVVLALAFNGYREWRISTLKRDIAGLEVRLSQGQRQNMANLKLSGEFARQSKLVEDVQKFFSLNEPPLDFVIAITESRPENIAYQSISFTLKEPVVKKKQTAKREDYLGEYKIRGMLKGSSAEALTALNSYRSTLSNLDSLKDSIKDIEVSPPRRNPGLNLFEFEITLTLKAPKL